MTKILKQTEVVNLGEVVTLLPATVINSNGTVNNTAVSGLGKFSTANILLKISGKTFGAGVTLDVYLQYSPDDGTTWDDLYHFTQITNAAIGNGNYVTWLGKPSSTGAVMRAVTDGTLAADTFRQIALGNKLRVKTVAATFTAHTITVEVVGYFQ